MARPEPQPGRRPRCRAGSRRPRSRRSRPDPSRARARRCGRSPARPNSRRASRRSTAPGLLLRATSSAPRFTRWRNGSTESLPSNGLTVTQSAPRTSNSARAYASAVLPISPRLASRIRIRSSGMRLRSRSRIAYPADPICSKNARFGLKAQTCSMVSSTISRHRRSASAALAKPSGSRPQQSSDPDASTHASRRATNVTVLPDLPRRARLDRSLVRAWRVRHLDAILVLRGAVRTHARHPAVEDHRGETEYRCLLSVAVAPRCHRHQYSDIATDATLTGSRKCGGGCRTWWRHPPGEPGSLADVAHHLHRLRLVATAS